MTKKIHISPTGPMPCKADPTKPRSTGCGYPDSPHFDDMASAEAVFAKIQGSAIVPKKVEDTVEVVTSRDGYPALRHAFHQADNDIPGATYWVTHPDSARLLRIDVLQFDTTDLAADLEIYDTLVYMLHWEDSPDE